MEHRWGQRRSTNVAVRFVTRPARVGLGRVTDISATGAFLETNAPLSLLSLLYLEPAGPVAGTENIGRIPATVVRQSALGVGLEWCEFSAATTPMYTYLAMGMSGLEDAFQLPLPAIPPRHVAFTDRS